MCIGMTFRKAKHKFRYSVQTAQAICLILNCLLTQVSLFSYLEIGCFTYCYLYKFCQPDIVVFDDMIRYKLIILLFKYAYCNYRNRF